MRTNDNGNYQTVAVARLKRDSQGDWSQDASFIPPLLNVQASRWLLTERVPPFETDQSRPVLAGISGRSGLADGLRRWPVCIGLSLVAIAALWWGLNHWLDSLIATLLPGAGK